MNDPVTYPLHGACQCGNVTYTLTETPLAIVACHCRECQKLSTSAFSITALVKADSLHVRGELKRWERMADSGNRNVAEFCPTCGNRILHRNPDQPDRIKLKPSNLSDTRIIRPTMHVWISRKQDWVVLPENVACHDTQPPI